MNASLLGYLAAVGESLSEQGATDEAADQLASVAELVDRSTELSLAVNDASVPAVKRRAVLDELLDGKVRPEVQRLVDRAVTVVPAAEVTSALHWLARQVRVESDREVGSSASEDEALLGRLASRHRVAGYAAAVFEQAEVPELEEIEDQLFRFARTVESHRALRVALGDRSLPVNVRQQVVAELLGSRVLASTRRLAAYALRGGRARDIVSTLDSLVEEAARARGWRVARVHSAIEVGNEQRRQLGDALGRLTGAQVELQVTIEPELLGGVVVQVGDLLVDSSARHRLDQLKEHLLVSGAAYRVPEGRETADG